MRAFLGLGMWRWVVGNVLPFKMSIGWDFSDEPWKSYALVKIQLTFLLSKNSNFCILMIFELSLWNHDQDFIKWWLWSQNKLLTKNSDFWLQNDHFAPAVGCGATRAFDCAICLCEPWDLTCRCLTMYMGLWDLLEPLKTSISLKETKP